MQFGNRLADGGGVDFDQLLVVGELAEWVWDSEFFGIKLNVYFISTGQQCFELAQAGFDFTRLAQVTIHGVERLQAVAGHTENGRIIPRNFA